MIISSGLFESGVLQRTAGEVSDAPITGKCTAGGPVLARVTREGTVVPGFDVIAIGQAENGAFQGRLAGLPAGGPYAVELQVGSERLMVKDVLVGDLWILGGQSNMQGCGVTADGERPHQLVRAWYMDDRWATAQDPIHNMWATVDQVHIDLCGGVRPEKNTVRSAGPGVAFGMEMRRLTGVPQGVIACAHGGTSMAQWNPRLKRHGSRSLYGAALRRVKKLGGQVAGLVWYQGCSDAGTETAKVYTKAMQALVRAFRRDLNAPELPVAMVQIAVVYGLGDFPNWNDVQEQQRLLPKVIPHLATVPAVDLTLDDLIHISGMDQNRLGRRLAAAMHGLRTGAGAPPIEPKKVKVIYNKARATADVVVSFDNVVAGLQASGRPWGFSLAGDGPRDVIYRVDLDGNQAILRTMLPVTDITERVLYYGQGCAPYCNITDGADRALPAFGPMRLGEPRALTPYVRTLRVSEPLPMQGSIRELAYPARLDAQTREFPTTLCDTHLDAGRTKTPQVQYFACRLRCAEAMKPALLLGYDGPVKAWIDGREAFRDPKGINPAIPDESSATLVLEAGEHEVLVALDLNGDRAWGIYLRFERKDVPKGLLKKGQFVLPEILG